MKLNINTLKIKVMESTDQQPEEEGTKPEPVNDKAVDFAGLLSADDVTPELRQPLETIIAFAMEPDAHQRLMDPQVPLTLNISQVFAWVADKVPTGLRFSTSKDGQKPEKNKPQIDRTTEELIKATQYFIAKAMLAPGADHYRVLGLKIQSPTEEIQNNYRNVRRIFSPSEGSDSAQTCVMRISDAYVTLRDPQARRKYNERLFGKQSNLYVSSVELAAENAKSKTKTPHAPKSGQSTRRWPTYLTVLAVLAGVVYWGLQPNMPLHSGDEEGSTTESSMLEMAPPIDTERISSDTATIDEVIATLKENNIDTTLLEENAVDLALAGEQQRIEELASPSTPVSKPAVEPPAEVVEETASDVATNQASSAVPTGTSRPEVSPEEKKIQKLLNEANAHLEESRLTQPTGSNAFEKFQAVLALDPTNVKARDGLEKIAERYVSLARFRIRDGRHANAKTMINRGLEVLPNYPPLLSLDTEVNELLRPKPVVNESVATPTPPPAPVKPEPEPEVILAPVVESRPTVIPAPAPPPPESPRRPPYQDQNGLVSESVLDAIIEKFINTYEKGDLAQFLTLFAENARSNNRSSIDGIKTDYEALFATTESRLMRLRGMKWKRSANDAVGDSDFRLTIFRTGDARPKTFEGSLTFQIEVIEGRLLITGLFHSQDKVNR